MAPHCTADPDVPYEPIDGGVRITVHFHGGTTAVTTLTDTDIESLLEDEDALQSIDDLIEAVLTKPGKPTFQWLGDVYLHPQAVCGVELLDLGTKED